MSAGMLMVARDVDVAPTPVVVERRLLEARVVAGCSCSECLASRWALRTIDEQRHWIQALESLVEIRETMTRSMEAARAEVDAMLQSQFRELERARAAIRSTATLLPDGDVVSKFAASVAVLRRDGTHDLAVQLLEKVLDVYREQHCVSVCLEKLR